jgi:hypothetical protein
LVISWAPRPSEKLTQRCTTSTSIPSIRSGCSRVWTK